jgi:hypothetical protein
MSPTTTATTKKQQKPTQQELPQKKTKTFKKQGFSLGAIMNKFLG